MRFKPLAESGRQQGSRAENLDAIIAGTPARLPASKRIGRSLSSWLILLTALLPIRQAGAEDAKIVPRDPKAGPELIDLSLFYNGRLTETWHPASNMAGDTGNDLSELPRGIQNLDGVQFDIRGLIQLSADRRSGANGDFPDAAKGIKVGLRCQRLHFLHGAGFVDNEGKQIGGYLVHYADGQSVEVPIIYGENIRDWWAYRQLSQETKHATVAWIGQNKATKANGIKLQLFHLAWDNPRPEVMIESIDFESRPARSIPFLIAITAQPAAKEQ